VEGNFFMNLTRARFNPGAGMGETHPAKSQFNAQPSHAISATFHVSNNLRKRCGHMQWESPWEQWSFPRRRESSLSPEHFQWFMEWNSRLRGNDCTEERQCRANDTITWQSEGSVN
jgi:hypothetical protein